MSVPNVLATRYASAQMREIWAPEAKVVAERRLWLAVLRAQRDLGVDFGGADPDEVIAAYEAVVDEVDLESIAATTSRRGSRSSTPSPGTNTSTKA